VLLEGLGFPESTRWRDGKVWLCNWGPGEVLALTPAAQPDVVARVGMQALPFSIDWLPDGRLLIVDGPGRRVLVQAGDALASYADLTGLGSGPFYEIVVDHAGNAYVNGGAGLIVCIAPDGTVGEVANGLRWPNGMALIDDGRRLVVADSHAEQLIAFDVQADATLTGRRVWADLEHAPDGICADADGAIWVPTVHVRAACASERAARFSTGFPRTAAALLACSAAKTGRKLFVAAAQSRGIETAMNEGPDLTGQLLAAPDQPAPHAGHP
jgi:sugar lactone lactonase YvrE